VDDNNGGHCGPITVDGKQWAAPLHAPGLIAPGKHQIACGTLAGFQVEQGTTFHFRYWGP